MRKKIKSYKKEVIAFGVIILVILVGLITPSFAVSTPVSSVVITSQNTSYENKESGAWQVEKSGIWIGKGSAEVSFDVSSVLMSDNPYTDIIFVLDISSSMMGDKLERVKQDTTELLESLLSNGDNRAALITFDTESRIVSGLTNDKDLLIQEVNSLEFAGSTNYYQALVNVDTILKDYQKEDNREMIVLFLTDGYPNVDTPNQIAQYRYLKSEYPYITVNGIQYEMGSSILAPIKEVSDNQFIADMETLNNVLFNASVAPILYDNFQIVDYIDNNYFTLESEDNITVSEGEVKLEEENELQKITWTIPNYRSGSRISLSMKLKLKDELIGQGGVYPTNRSEQVISQIENQNENVSSTLTPVLRDDYQVIYEGNAPDGCSVENVPNNENHSVYDVVSISEEEASCSGYKFKGWEVVTDNVTKVNDDYFIMPESDVILRAKWGKVSISKSMDGEVYIVPTLYSLIEEQAVMDNVASTYVSSSSGIDFSEASSDTNGKGVYTRAGTENDEFPIYYYRGDVDNNHVKFADYCWLIVRTTDTGGIKLIYDGVPGSDGSCNNTGDASQIGTSAFNTSSTSPADVGYMYGDNSLILRTAGPFFVYDSAQYVYGNTVTWNGSSYSLIDTMVSSPSRWSSERTTLAEKYHYTCLSTSSTCSNVSYVTYFGNNTTLYYISLSNGVNIENAKERMFENTNNSSIKDYIDNWYATNMTNYTKYLEDTIWCNDRSFAFGSLKGENVNAGTDFSAFSPYDRVWNSQSPSLSCLNSNDSFTVNSENGNGALIYPVGLLTADEVLLAGSKSSNNNSYYLYTGTDYWTLSPNLNNNTIVSLLAVQDDGGFVANAPNMDNGVRISISLVADVKIAEGDGSSASPYEILMD